MMATNVITRAFTLGLFTMPLLAAGIGTAHAQTAITDPQKVAACLCAQGALTAATQSKEAELLKYQAAIDRLHAINGQVAAQRDRYDPNNAEQLDAYRRLVADAERANAALYNRATPDYNAAVDRYNDAVSVYNATCTGGGIDPALKAQVAATLFCPAAGAMPTITTTTSSTTTTTTGVQHSTTITTTPGQ